MHTKRMANWRIRFNLPAKPQATMSSRHSRQRTSDSAESERHFPEGFRLAGPIRLKPSKRSCITDNDLARGVCNSLLANNLCSHRFDCAVALPHVMIAHSPLIADQD